MVHPLTTFQHKTVLLRAVDGGRQGGGRAASSFLPLVAIVYLSRRSVKETGA